MKETAEELAAKRERANRSAMFEFAGLKPAPKRYQAECETCHSWMNQGYAASGETECSVCKETQVEAARKSRTMEDVVRENYESGYIDIMTPSQLLAAISNALEELK
jgi:hypothetical protein